MRRINKSIRNKVSSCLIHIFIDSERFSIFEEMKSGNWDFDRSTAQREFQLIIHESRQQVFRRSGVRLDVSKDSTDIWIFKLKHETVDFCTHKMMWELRIFEFFDRNRWFHCKFCFHLEFNFVCQWVAHVGEVNFWFVAFAIFKSFQISELFKYEQLQTSIFHHYQNFNRSTWDSEAS